jgi:hypothetical protein
MKRFTVVTAIFSVSLLAAWVFFQANLTSSPKAMSSNATIPVYDATGAMLKAIHSGDAVVPVTGSEARIVPVYDATGAMLDAINPNKKTVTVPAYDATGAMQDAISP